MRYSKITQNENPRKAGFVLMKDGNCS
jgi:hypothetical protein